MFGCGSSGDKLVRVHDELVDRHAPVGRAASLDEVNQERLNAAFEARHLTRREALVTQVVDVNKGVHAMVAKDLFAPELRSVDPLGARAAPVPAPAQRPGS
jgi:hypothetical protein